MVDAECVCVCMMRRFTHLYEPSHGVVRSMCERSRVVAGKRSADSSTRHAWWCGDGVACECASPCDDDDADADPKGS